MDPEITLLAVGDLILGDHPHYLGLGVKSLIDKKGIFIFQYVENVFFAADIIFGNLETALSDYGDNISCENKILKGRPQFAKQLKKIRFNILNIANNHIQQHGKNTLLETVDVLLKNDIKIIGLNDLQPQIIFKKNISLGFLGYSFEPDRCDSKPVYAQGNEKKILSEIQKIKNKVDHTVVSLHWGDEYIDIPSRKQIDLAHQLIDNGADIILGHHPHALQPIEKYKNGVVAYSLGNFVSDMCQNLTKKSAILKLSLSKKSIDDIEVIPVCINKNYQPEILTETIDNLQITNAVTPLSDEKYSNLLKKNLIKNRMEYIKFLSRNFYKFKFSHLIWIIKSAIKRRFFNI